MKQFQAFLLIVLLILVAASCKKKGSGSVIPHISLLGMEPNHAKISTDTIYLYFNITDGDGDIGVADQRDIIMIDSRQKDTNIDLNNVDTQRIGFPEIPDGAINPDKGLDGTFILPLWSNVLRTRTDSTAKDSLTYEIYVVDKAGHKSNHVTTPEIYLEQ